jgi:hypothetical protein
MFWKKLECYWLAQLEIFSAIDFTHSTFAEQPNDPVALGQNCSRHKTRIIDGVK